MSVPNGYWWWNGIGYQWVAYYDYYPYYPTQVLTDADVERIANKVVEKTKPQEKKTLKLNDPLTKQERLDCLRYIRSEWSAGPLRHGEKGDANAPNTEYPEAYQCIGLMYRIADEYERWAKERGLL